MKINIRKLHHVQICIPPGTEDQAREFYGKVLGLEEIAKPKVERDSGGLWFQMADIQLHLGVEEARSTSKRHPAFEVEHLEEIKTYLREQRVRIKDETSIPNFNRFSFFDPFGNRIECLERV